MEIPVEKLNWLMYGTQVREAKSGTQSHHLMTQPDYLKQTTNSLSFHHQKFEGLMSQSHSHIRWNSRKKTDDDC